MSGSGPIGGAVDIGGEGVANWRPTNSDGGGHQESVVHIITETHRFGKPNPLSVSLCGQPIVPHLNWCLLS